jgi:3-hydroxybutyryl-CoA dehydrogenase
MANFSPENKESSRRMKVAVIGFGMMGRQIAQVFAQHGFEVSATDTFPEALKAGIIEIENGLYGLKTAVAKGKLSEKDMHQALTRIHTSSNIQDACEEADLVIEAAIEELTLKRDLFSQLDSATEPATLLASNTSTISISRIAEQAKNRERILGMHFFNPAQVTKLVEIIRGNETSDDTLNTALGIVRQIGKTPVIAMDEPGFVANRLGLTLYMEASRMLEDQVANVKDIDNSMKLAYGHPMGPFETADLVGLDTRLRNLESLYQTTGDIKWLPPKALREMVNDGYIGDRAKKKGSKGGYYEYFNVEP